MEDLYLAKIDEVRLAIESASTVQEVKTAIDACEAVKVYAQRTKMNSEVRMLLAENIVRAERKLGQMLAAAKAVGQIGTYHGNRHQEKKEVVSGDFLQFKIKDAGISKDLSSRAQRIAAIPAADFDKIVGELKAEGKLTAKRIIQPKSVRERNSSGNPVARRRTSETEVTSDMLSMSAQQKLETAIAQHKKRLEVSFHAEVNARVKEFMEQTLGPQLSKEQAEARRVMDSRKGVMDRKTYRKILACLHPDWVTDPAQKVRYEEAFRLFSALEKRVLDEKNSPTKFTDIPSTAKEWDELRRKATEARKAKRSSRTKADNLSSRG